MKDREVTEKSKIEISQSDSGKGESSLYLDGYYSIRLGLTGEIEEDVLKLYDFYGERMSDSTDASTIKETLYEYILLFNNRGLNGAEIVADKISMVSRKTDKKKKNVSYLIGCLRNALEYGLSSTGSQIEKRIVNAFESRFKIKLSPNGITTLLGLATEHNTTNILFSLLEADFTVEDLVLDTFSSLVVEMKGESLWTFKTLS